MEQLCYGSVAKPEIGFHIGSEKHTVFLDNLKKVLVPLLSVGAEKFAFHRCGQFLKHALAKVLYQRLLCGVIPIKRCAGYPCPLCDVRNGDLVKALGQK